MARNHVIILLIALAVFIIGIDIWFAADDIKYNTWSAIIYDASLHTIVIAYSIGVLAAHFLFPVCRTMKTHDWVVLLTTPVACQLVTWGVIALVLYVSPGLEGQMESVYQSFNVLFLSLGMIAGRQFFPNCGSKEPPR